MSGFVDRSMLRRVVADKPWWQDTFHPGDTVPVSGIYRCAGCGREDCCNKDDPFPPQNHHQHNALQGNIRWRLNVRAETTPR